MPDASPTRWHLAHTTWFFETLVLPRLIRGYRPYDADFGKLFNSYYLTLGQPFPRHRRGLLSRPTVADVMAYRRHVDASLTRALTGSELDESLRSVFELGLHHEQQHQELILTDIKHLFSCNPCLPAYRDEEPPGGDLSAPSLAWIGRNGGLHLIGHAGEAFSYDNERPRHQVLVQGFEIASRPVTNGEYLRFIEDGGYQRPELWLSDGWKSVEEQSWRCPLYWREGAGGWSEFTLSGLRALAHRQPLVPVSYYEADAFARWADARLPTEAEWEISSHGIELEGNFVESGALHPRTAVENSQRTPRQFFGDVWEWTASPYTPYPGYRPPDGPLGEYNGKFMCNQFVLRGGSCVTPKSHIRATYRNFFPPDARWQFTGIRLARHP